MKRLFAVLGFLLVGFSSPGQRLYTVTGSVFDAGTTSALAGVHVYIPGTTVGTVTDSNGFFSLTLSARDSLTLLFSYVGYQTAQRTIPFQSDQTVFLSLAAGQLLDELTVRPIDQQELLSRKPQMSQIRLSAEQLAKIPALLGEKDVLRVLQLLPGVQKGSEGNTGIYVRGGGPDQNLILLDDAVLYNSGHLLGFFSAFNGSAIQQVELTKGGFPARFGGRLSSVIEVNTKEGNTEKLSGKAGLGLVSSRLMLTGPLGRKRSGKLPASFLVAGRRTYVDLVTRPFTVSSGSDAPLTNTFFYDVNARLSYPIGSNDKLFLSAFRSRDAFVNRSPTGSSPLQGSLNWQNTVSTLRWHHRFSDDTFINLSLIYSQYHLNVANDGIGFRDTTRLRYALRYRSGIRDLGLKYALEFAQHNHQFRFGLQSTHHRFTPGAVVATGDVVPVSRFFIDALETGLYAEDTWHPGQHWHLNAGFRLSHFFLLRSGTLSTGAGGTPGPPSEYPTRPRGRPIQYLRPEPRLSFAYQIDSSLSIKASYAQMNQYAHLLSNNGLGLPADLWIPTTGRIRPQQARQVAIGLAKEFIHANKPSRNLTVTLEGYYKALGNSISYAEGTSFLSSEPATDAQLWENNITSGRGWSYGGEMLLQKKTGRLSGWVGYTLAWTWWQFPALNGGRKFLPRYDRRHDASVVAMYELRPGITFSGTWVYGTGQALMLPISRFSGYENRPPTSVGSGRPSEQLFGSVPNVKEYGPRNGFRAQAYHRLDTGFQFRRKRKRVVRTWEVSVYNLYNRRNPFYYSLEGKDQGVGQHSKTVLYKYSLFPVVPSVSYTLSF